MEIVLGLITIMCGASALYYFVKTACDYGYVLDVLKEKRQYNPMDFLDVTRLSVYLARRRYSKALREKQLLENIKRDKLNY